MRVNNFRDFSQQKLENIISIIFSLIKMIMVIIFMIIMIKMIKIKMIMVIIKIIIMIMVMATLTFYLLNDIEGCWKLSRNSSNDVFSAFGPRRKKTLRLQNIIGLSR